MRFGFVVPNNFGVDDPHAVVRLGVLAEELGFASVWVNHHVLNVGYVRDRLGDQPYQDALVMLTWLAAQTSRVQLGTSVLVMPYLHPMVLAKQLATLDQLCGGRLVIGLGAGSLPEENAALGAPYTDRGAYCNEFIQVLRLMWTGQPVSFAGQFFNFDSVVSSPRPLQQPNPPLVIGGNRPPALRRVAQLGDGWHPLNCSADGVRRRLEVIADEAAAVPDGRVPELVQVRLDMARVDEAAVAEYAAAGVTDLVMSLNTGDTAEIERSLERFAATIFA
ncbi:MAG: TIGR03619 family F420-dependent LLM class oxidoreductase [Pseudomonadota bacterium]